jgi:hypothetical protein
MTASDSHFYVSAFSAPQSFPMKNTGTAWRHRAHGLTIADTDRSGAGAPRQHELREYTPARCRTMLACLIQRTRATRLDDLVTMLARFIGRIEAKARTELETRGAKRLYQYPQMQSRPPKQ